MMSSNKDETAVHGCHNLVPRSHSLLHHNLVPRSPRPREREISLFSVKESEIWVRDFPLAVGDLGTRLGTSHTRELVRAREVLKLIL